MRGSCSWFLAFSTSPVNHGSFIAVLAAYEPLAVSGAGYAFAILMGLLWGSFANVCIYRWPPTDEFPDGRSVVKPGSHCFACKTPIRWYDNVPLVSYLWLRGKCRTCKAPFSARYLLVEVTTAGLFALAWWATVMIGVLWEPFPLRLERWCIEAAFSFVMVVMAFIDIDHKLILNKLMWPAIALFYAATFLLPERHWYDGLIGAGLGYGLPWTIGTLYLWIRKREGMGLGDSTLLALIGAYFGWQGVVVSLFGGSVLGTILTLTGRLVGRGGGPAEDDADAPIEGEDGEQDASLMQTEIPFGPYLGAAALFYMFAEPWIQLHFRLFGG